MIILDGVLIGWMVLLYLMNGDWSACCYDLLYRLSWVLLVWLFWMWCLISCCIGRMIVMLLMSARKVTMLMSVFLWLWKVNWIVVYVMLMLRLMNIFWLSVRNVGMSESGIIVISACC